MSFVLPVRPFRRAGRDCSRVDVPLFVASAGTEIGHTFRLDTGADITTVSEDVAVKLGLATTGSSIPFAGVSGGGAGQMVAVSFRFPPDDISGNPDPLRSSVWVVVTGRTGLALLSLQDVHEHFALGTDDTHMYFTNR
jgi:hypothetical protein